MGYKLVHPAKRCPPYCARSTHYLIHNAVLSGYIWFAYEPYIHATNERVACSHLTISHSAYPCVFSRDSGKEDSRSRILQGLFKTYPTQFRLLFLFSEQNRMPKKSWFRRRQRHPKNATTKIDMKMWYNSWIIVKTIDCYWTGKIDLRPTRNYGRETDLRNARHRRSNMHLRLK